MMDGLKKVAAILALMLVAALAASALARSDDESSWQQQSTGFQGAFGMQQTGQAPTKDILATARDMPEISMFLAAVKATGYDQALQGEGPVIVFAPTDQAIRRDMAVTDANSLISDPDAARDLIESNVVTDIGQPPPEETTQISFTSANGKDITAVKSDSRIMVNDIPVVRAVEAKNGILIVTDGIVGM